MHDEDRIVKEVVAPNKVEKAVAFLRRGYDTTTLNVSILNKDKKTSDDNYGPFGNTFSIFVLESENYDLDYFDLEWVSDKKLRIQYKESEEYNLNIKVTHRYENDIEYIVK
ncbi:hypothetical protein [Acetivibrio cellulolyticus]|uniref:hypothetical protein n=1 Tax=Acetivibrio cellulolyticus TaxID=35830 RepID=UPI0002EF211D|nr:hypothetical protein [Acetivibrio cellulolyticus]